MNYVSGRLDEKSFRLFLFRKKKRKFILVTGAAVDYEPVSRTLALFGLDPATVASSF